MASGPRIAAALGSALGMNDDRLAQLRLAAMLHDVGMIGVPDAVLRKEAPSAPKTSSAYVATR